MLASVIHVFSYVIYLNGFMTQSKNDVILYCCTMGDVIYTFLLFIFYLPFELRCVLNILK